MFIQLFSYIPKQNMTQSLFASDLLDLFSPSILASGSRYPAPRSQRGTSRSRGRWNFPDTTEPVKFQKLSNFQNINFCSFKSFFYLSLSLSLDQF